MRSPGRCAILFMAVVAAVGVYVAFLRGSPTNTDGTPQPAPEGPPLAEKPTASPSAAPTKGKLGEATQLRSVAPASVIPEVSDKSLEPLVDKSLPLNQRVFSNMSARYPTVVQAQDYAPLCKVLQDTSEDDVVRHEVASLLQRSKYPGLADTLCKVLDNPNEKARFGSFAAQHLGLLANGDDSVQREAAIEKLRPCLTDLDIPVRREALLALVRVNDPEAIRSAVAWLQPDSNATQPGTDMRDLAIRCVQDLELREHIPTIRKYVRDPNEIVRIAAIVALAHWGDEESRTAFEEAAKSPNGRLQRCGKMALDRLDQVRRSELKP